MSRATLIFDGELYTHDLKHDFNKITSLVKKTKPTIEDNKESAELVQYWVYDIVDTTKTFKERNEWINFELFTKEYASIKPVWAAYPINSQELDTLYAEYLQHGFEGQMVRLDTKYENKRSKNLLKRKEFQDEEYVILDVIEGVGNKSGVAGAMVFENELGISFNSNIKGNRDYLREVLENKQELIGQLATVKFFNKTPGNSLPRFPYVIAVRNFE